MMGKPVDPIELDDRHGEFLVRFARKSLEYYFRVGERLKPPEDADPLLSRPGAVFVTIETYYDYDHRELRGCIGVTRPVKPLLEAVVDSTLNSAFNDPRFPPMEEYELDQVTFEVSVLSEFEYLGDTPSERIVNLQIGRDGLIVERPPYAGLLLPSVPIDHLWDKTTFLSETCIKAGLYPDCWLDPKTKVYRFRARVWRERYPMGPVEYRSLRDVYRAKLINVGIDPGLFEEAV